jgi:hypothetical protein
VYVLGYPHLFSTGTCPGGLSLVKRQAINQGVDLLSGVTARQAWAAGFNYVDVRAAFAGHGVCSTEPWINDATSPLGAYHPNATGYQYGYLRALDAYVRCQHWFH